MKKKFLALMLIAAGAFAITANAQDTGSADVKNCKDKTECCCKNAKGDKHNKKKDKKRDGKNRQEAWQARQAEAFKGITLTESQQAALDEINANRAAKFAERKEQAKQAKAARKAEASNSEGTRPENAMRQDLQHARLEYFKQVQAVLTPEQYVIFLENTASGAPRMDARHNHGPKAKKNRGVASRQKPDADKKQQSPQN